MRRPRPRSFGDLDAVDVLLIEDEGEDVAADEVSSVLHELALGSIAWRSTWPGEPERLSEPEAVADDPVPVGLARRLARRYRRRAMVAAVLALTVAGTTAVVDARQTAARAEAFAARPAVLGETPSAPAVVWRMPGRVVSDQDDVLLVVDGASLRAVSPATGEVVWTASDAAGRAASSGGCFPVDESRMPNRAPVDDGTGPRDLVACVADGPGSGPAADHTTTTAAADVVVVDATTGRTRHTVTTDGALLLAEPAGRDLLLVAAQVDGRVRATRWDLDAGSPRWDSVSPEPVLATGVVGAVERRPDSVTVASFAVDLRSGEVLDADAESRRPYPYGEDTLPGGARASWSWYRDGTFRLGRVAGGSSSRPYTLPGPPLLAPVSDGSEGGVLVVRTAAGDRLRGVDLRTGRMRWTRSFPAPSSLRALALVDGVLLAGDDGSLTALDVRTGTTLWGTRVDPDATARAAPTDGEVVLLPVRADDGGALQLVATRVVDGTVEWRTELPSGTRRVAVVDHRLVAATDDEVIGLG